MTPSRPHPGGEKKLIFVEPRLVTYLIGARSGGGLGLPRFTFDTIDVLFEADADCITELENHLAATKQSVIVLPYALGAKDGPGILHINYDPYTSSVYPTAPRSDEVNGFIGIYDVISDKNKLTIEARPIQLHALDNLSELRTGQIPRPDVLILDTQGSEFEILQGAADSLNSAVAIVTEVEFSEFYAGQHLFSDFNALLGKHDLQFICFERIASHHEPFRFPIGMRGKGLTTDADVLYLRSIDSAQKDPGTLKKLAFVAHHLRHHAYAFKCMEVFRHRYGSLRSTVDGTGQSNFLADLEEAVERQPKLLPWTFQDFYTPEDSRNRFNEASAAQVAATVARRTADYARFFIDHQEIVERLASSDWTPIEEVFRSYNLHRNAEAMRSARVELIADSLRFANENSGATKT